MTKVNKNVTLITEDGRALGLGDTFYYVDSVLKKVVGPKLVKNKKQNKDNLKFSTYAFAKSYLESLTTQIKLRAFMSH